MAVPPMNADPFTIDDVVAAGSLFEALDQLVFEHPEIKSLISAAREAAALEHTLFEQTAGLVGRVMGLDEPVLCIRHVSHQRRRIQDAKEFLELELKAEANEFYDRPYPPALSEYYGAINRRVGLLFQMLQEGRVVGFGHTNDGHLVPLARTIWSHEDFYIHRYDGDIYEAGREILVRKWTAVMLVAPVGVGAQPNVSRELHPLPPLATEYSGPSSLEQSAPADVIVGIDVASQVSFDECVAELVSKMKASPNQRTTPKAACFTEAQTKWGISQRSFELAWKHAIKQSRAFSWSKAGPTRKAQHIPRSD